MVDNKTQKSIITEDANLNLKLAETQIPKPTSGQVLVKLLSSTIQPSDPLSGNGYFFPRTYPLALGLEGHGIVIESPDDQNLVGKYVSFWSLAASSWSEYSIVPVDELLVTRDFSKTKEDLGAASNLFLNPLTALGLVSLAKDFKSVAFNAGYAAVSKMLIKLFSEVGIKTLAIVRQESQIKELTELGATVVLNSKDSEYSSNLAKAYADLEVKFFIDCVNGDDAFLSLKHLPDNSTVIQYGALSGAGLSQEHIDELAKRNITPQRFFFLTYFKALSSEDKEKVSKKIDSEIYTTFFTKISKYVKQEELPSAYKEYFENSSSGKVVILF